MVYMGIDDSRAPSLDDDIIALPLPPKRPKTRSKKALDKYRLECEAYNKALPEFVDRLNRLAKRIKSGK